MGKKTVTFEFMKDEAIKVIDSLSKYGVSVSAKVNHAVIEPGMPLANIYVATIICKSRELSWCLSDIMALNREGVAIERMFVR